MDRRIMRSPYGIESELLENLHVPADNILGDHMACRRMLHMRALRIDLQ